MCFLFVFLCRKTSDVVKQSWLHVQREVTYEGRELHANSQTSIRIRVGGSTLATPLYGLHHLPTGPLIPTAIF